MRAVRHPRPCAFGCDDAPLLIAAAASLLQYAGETQRGAIPHVRSLRTERRSETVILDAVSRRNLEIDRSLSGHPEHSLAGVLDKCVTAMGSRLLRRWLQQPLRNNPALELRLDAVDSLLTSGRDRLLRPLLRDVGDMERVLARVALRSARPRDLANLRDALAMLPEIRSILATEPRGRLEGVLALIGDHQAIRQLLEKAVRETPAVVLREGGVIATGYDEELDELRGLAANNADDYLADLEQRERTRTGVATLKVGYNRVHGYYIEVGRSQHPEVPAEYVRRQTLKNAERYITPELKTFEDKVLSARERALAREKQLYEALLDELATELSDACSPPAPRWRKRTCSAIWRVGPMRWTWSAGTG